MPKKDTETDENDAVRKKPFRVISKGGIESNGSEDTIFRTVLERKKTSRDKTSSNDASPRRVSDLLKSLSKFDEDVARLRGLEPTSFKSIDALVDQLNIDEMEKELKTFLFNRDTIKSELDTLVMNINQTSYNLKQEEEKIQKIKIKIQQEKEIGAQQGD